MRKRGLRLEEITADHVITLISIYLSEWEHRDELLWKQVFKYFYATLVVLFLPNIASFLHIDLPAFPAVLFPAIALLLALIFMYVGIGYAKRLEASSKTYQKLLDVLPNELQRVRLADPSIKHGKFFEKRMSVVLSTLMFLGLAILSIVMMIYHLTYVAT